LHLADLLAADDDVRTFGEAGHVGRGAEAHGDFLHRAADAGADPDEDGKGDDDHDDRDNSDFESVAIGRHSGFLYTDRACGSPLPFRFSSPPEIRAWSNSFMLSSSSVKGPSVRPLRNWFMSFWSRVLRVLGSASRRASNSLRSPILRTLPRSSMTMRSA